MIVLAGSFRIAAGRREEALPHLRAMVAASRAEPGCLAYSFAFDAMDDHLVRVFEAFADSDALQAHRDSAHMAAWRAVWAEAGLSDRDMGQYDIAAWKKI